MPILGLNFDKLAVERKKVGATNINIKTSMGITGIKKEELSVGSKKEPLLRVSFEFGVDYEPDVAAIKIEGNLVYTEEAKKLDSILKAWKKDRKLDENMMSSFMNAVFLKCSIKSLMLSQEVNLPPSIRLPTVKPTTDASQYIG